jgi:hypothetical protein
LIIPGFGKGPGSIPPTCTSYRTRCWAEACEPVLQKFVQVRWKGQGIARSDHTAATVQGARELERKEGVTARRLPEPDQGRPRERHVESRQQQFS